MALPDRDRDREAKVEELRRTHPLEAAHERREQQLRATLQDLFKKAFTLRGGTHLELAQLMLERAELRADALRRVLAGAVPKDLVELTATPVNNSLTDLYNLIGYFASNDAAFADVGITSLRAYFQRAIALHPDDLSPEHLFDVLDEVAVRRTRRFVKNHYVGDRITIKRRGATDQVPNLPGCARGLRPG
jgi:hypothetical protein